LSFWVLGCGGRWMDGWMDEDIDARYRIQHTARSSHALSPARPSYHRATPNLLHPLFWFLPSSLSLFLGLSLASCNSNQIPLPSSLSSELYYPLIFFLSCGCSQKKLLISSFPVQKLFIVTYCMYFPRLPLLTFTRFVLSLFWGFVSHPVF